MIESSREKGRRTKVGSGPESEVVGVRGGASVPVGTEVLGPWISRDRAFGPCFVRKVAVRTGSPASR
ncbi:hypothetical protein ACYOEI_25775, partial [Singulisphaera rosea]